MGYLSCRAESSIATCRSISSVAPSQTQRTKKKNTQKPKSSPRSISSGGKEEEDGFASGSTSHPHRHIRHFTYRELESATHNFSDAVLLGRGSHGSVYKAVLRGGRSVAVKRPSRRPAAAAASTLSSSSATRDEVENEIDILSQIRSPRVVNLIGFTPSTSSSSNSAKKERLLVVEFMPNGTLYDFLHSNPRPPGWSRRLRLALQTAKALLTLHSSRPPVIHRDVKSANILIDHHFNARLGDFGLALRDSDGGDHFPYSARSTPPAGTLGYLDPCYVTPENLSTKTDVFSFGILLFEIISGRKAIDVAYSPPSVVEWAVPLLKKGKVLAIYDPRIAPPKNSAARRQLASLAARCVRSCKEQRPSMEEVVEQLKVMSRTMPSRAWNGLSVGNPCSVVETERTLSKLNPNTLNWDQSSKNPVIRIAAAEETGTSEEEMPLGVKKPSSSSSKSLRNGRRVFSDGSTRGSRNLMDLMARPDEVTSFAGMGVMGSQRSVISRSRTLHVTRDYYDRNGMVRLRRNQTVKRDHLEPFSRLNGLENLDAKLHGGQARDAL